MDDGTPIACLNPELPELASKHINAVVSLIWPYSSLTRQFALLLAEPDFRLRRKKGQVKVRFSGSSAKSIAATGVGIGDDVVLELRGARFVQEEPGDIQTPGRSIDWELAFTHTVVAQIFRKGSKIGDLDIVDAASTPGNISPARKQSLATPIKGPGLRAHGGHQWTSPAFLKRGRLSDGFGFEARYDPLADGIDDEHDKKRRKSYRDWNTWKYSARTPSPEKEDVDEQAIANESPTCHKPLLISPISPPRTDEGTHLEETTSEDQHVITASSPAKEHDNQDEFVQDSLNDDFIRDADYYDLYAGPDERPPSNVLLAFGGDAEPNTEDKRAESTKRYPTATRHSMEQNLAVPIVDESHTEYQEMEVDKQVDGAPQIQIFMPPPTLPALQTDFGMTIPLPGMLTPIGREPSSPILKPQDSATLPMPSPFPGERDGEGTSFLDLLGTRDEAALDLSGLVQDQHQQGAPLSDANEDVEADFYSSVNSANAFAFHSTHESAFTDVRFTFGLDGSMFSRLNEQSESLEPKHLELQESEVHDVDRVETANKDDGGIPSESLQQHNRDVFDEFTTDQPSSTSESVSSEPFEEHIIPASQFESGLISISSDSNSESVLSEVETESEVESGDEDDEELVEEMEVDAETSSDISATLESGYALNTDMELVTDGHVHAPSDELQESNQRPNRATSIVDLGSPSEDDSEEEWIEPTASGVVGHENGIQSGKEGDNKSENDRRDEAPPTNLHFEQTSDVAPNAKVGEGRNSMDVDPRVDTIQNHNTHNTETGEELATHSPFITGSFDNVPERLSSENLPDIKLESIEEDASLFILSPHLDQNDIEGGSDQSSDSEGELTIAVPEEGHRIGELQLHKVANTAPARNTRSKTKTSLSPMKDDVSSSQPKSKGSGKKKGSFESIARTSLTPIKTRSRSTMSPTKDVTVSTSPYGLRSRSKRISPSPQGVTQMPPLKGRGGRQPSNVLSPPPLKSSFSKRRSPGNRSANDSNSVFKSSQELGGSQGRFADVQYVKDSEESSLHSENSLSTNHLSGGLASASNQEDAPDVRVKEQSILQDHSGVTPYFGPTSTEHSVSSKPPQRRGIYEISSDHSQEADEDYQRGEITPRAHRRAQGIIYSDLMDSSDDSEFPSSPPAPVLEEPGLVAPERTFASINQQSIANSNMPITPQATQQSFTVSQRTLAPDQVGEGWPMTPQLTQTTSIDAQGASFANDMEVREIESEPASPSVHSEDVSDVETETQLAKAVESPSIGLSTSISYYTPLKDLSYFLNRSSEFHSSANPDTLALVTSSTTIPTRAAKGPKHWNTTLHITDLSIFPEVRTVQVFRPYSMALPAADKGDVVLLRGFQVKSLNRQPMLISGDESAWCVWRWGRPVWGAPKMAFGELKAREEVKGPVVERGEGEWKEVERLRAWWIAGVGEAVEAAKDGNGNEHQNGDVEVDLQEFNGGANEDE
ncbi:hypothetical protein B0J11DRAFT_425611 [Dendryphion nanum]|uniref:Telomeric single stranded DNA binding POT1/Cdc13 domain-containing protein n=1 Tax=Dendryphion nanum TaxID=256645 RepID=A0A9P9IWN3_9PLEO|nr:hypothetical protein B0J11DRAFT_425611 [Dendryphion nanum]